MSHSQLALYLIGTAMTFYMGHRAYKVMKSERILAMGVWKRLRIKHFLAAAACAYLFVETVASLYPLHPVFRFSLLSLLSGSDASYNVAFSPAVLAGESGTAMAKAFILAFLSVLAIAMPSLNFEEEQAMRQGKNAWGDVPVQSAVFGMLHIFAGVPVAVCVALMLVGAVWHTVYKFRYERNLKLGLTGPEAELEAALESTAYHNAFNNLGLIFFAYFLLRN